jgi:hypothetical protein
VTSQLLSQGYEPRAYTDDHTALEIITIISNRFRQLLKARVRKSPYYGIMVDETTDKATTQQLIVYIKYLQKLDDGTVKIVTDYLDLVAPESANAEDITVITTVFF